MPDQNGMLSTGNQPSVCVCAVKLRVSFELDDYFLPQGKHIVDFVI